MPACYLPCHFTLIGQYLRDSGLPLLLPLLFIIILSERLDYANKSTVRAWKVGQHALDMCENANKTAVRALNVSEHAFDMCERANKTAVRALEVGEHAFDMCENANESLCRSNDIYERALDISEAATKTCERAMCRREDAGRSGFEATDGVGAGVMGSGWAGKLGLSGC